MEDLQHQTQLDSKVGETGAAVFAAANPVLPTPLIRLSRVPHSERQTAQ